MSIHIKDPIIMMFPNGNTAFFVDEKQVPELQVSWLDLWLEFIESKGFNPEGWKITLPDGRVATPFRVNKERSKSDWNWRIIQ